MRHITLNKEKYYALDIYIYANISKYVGLTPDNFKLTFYGVSQAPFTPRITVVAVQNNFTGIVVEEKSEGQHRMTFTLTFSSLNYKFVGEFNVMQEERPVSASSEIDTNGLFLLTL